MKILVLIPLFPHFAGISASVVRVAPLHSQRITEGSVDFTEADTRHLLIANHDDPIESIRLLDPDYAAILDEPRLVQVLDAQPIWIREVDELRLRKQGLSFIDLTKHEYLFTSKSSSDNDTASRYRMVRPSAPAKGQPGHRKYESGSNLGNLTTFYNRYYRSQYGAQSSRWIYKKVLEIIEDAPPNVHLSLGAFTHEFAQISVIARFEPTCRSTPDHAIKMPVVVIGSHLDSANYEFPWLPAPGADDGGSGTVTILDAFRALVHSSFRPDIPVEFHWYATEEGGLLGSQDIVSEYVYQRKDVMAMIQFDMAAYVHKDTTPTVTFITNNVDGPLTNWTMVLATTYTSSPVAGAKSFPGGILSWHRVGVPVISATKADPVQTPNPYIHTVDVQMVVKEGEFFFAVRTRAHIVRVGTILKYALELAKVAVGIAVELGGWETNSDLFTRRQYKRHGSQGANGGNL